MPPKKIVAQITNLMAGADAGSSWTVVEESEDEEMEPDTQHSWFYNIFGYEERTSQTEDILFVMHF